MAGISFDWLSQLPDNFMSGQNMRSQFDTRRAFREGLPRNPDGSVNYGAAVDMAARSGNIDLMRQLAPMIDAQSTRNYQRERDARDFELRRRQIEASIEGTKVPPGFQRAPNGNLAPVPGGPQDPAYIERASQSRIRDLTPTDKKAIMEAEDDLGPIQSTIGSLERARELTPKALTGPFASQRGWAGAALPGGSMIADPEAAKATVELDQIMSSEAIKNMSSTLKGATTDREMMEFKRIMADQTVPAEIKMKTVDRMLSLANARQKINADRLNQLRAGSYYKHGGGQSNVAQPQSQGQSGTSPRINSKADFDALPSGSRFIAPDGSIRVKP